MNTCEGERIKAEVEEVLSKQNLIVSYDGQLLRVMNSSSRIFKKGDRLDLVVVKKEPLELQLFEAYQKNFDRFA